jgi:hypothetical protein
MKLALSIGEQRTTIGPASSPHQAHLAIGWSDLVRRFFKHRPPTPLELEAAIAAVEDEIMRVRDEIPGASSVETADPAIADIAIAAGVAPAREMIIALGAVEQCFLRFAGSAAADDGPQFGSTLLILRELMHHFGFHELRIRRG